ncbi:Smr/MutS family protein [Mycoplasma sp. ES3157-GEN-MYC]|uniref:Smr/MutS family protein n=1 Tax=Mycoplasma miroungigenitalium TaxID=754515 RepID=A0A6M4JFI1_9MOLU|nr:Smr/MutS family protein [Mycoplasma miroungigenitalium]MBU4690681.1 Smr/MutS family protein [Mycoplasma miroungigenitalium]MBU4691950.1 Smr/MutS family protein [Mycoplasma miroungigenitalium]QJR43802.1 Smr/MutS family protein [Mycoplasma miroungigenitalium]
MIYSIDLHGFSVEEATSRILLALQYAEEQDYDYLDIITGHGTGAMKVTVENLLNEENYDYSIIRDGCYRVLIYGTFR